MKSDPIPAVSPTKFRPCVLSPCAGADVKELVGVVISFEPPWKVMVLNEHRPLTEPPHPDSGTSENVQR